MPKRHYINNEGRHPELAADRRPQADRDAIPHFDHVLLLYWGRVRGPHPVGTADAATRPGRVRYVQQVLHHARHHHDLPVPGAVGPGDDRELPDPDHDRREGPGVSEDQPAELVPVPRGRDAHAGGPGAGRGRYGLDVYHAAFDPLPEHARDHGGDGDLHRRASARSLPG